MCEILETDDHVTIPPMMYYDSFYRITYLIKEEIRKYKWIEGEKGRLLSWQQARTEWTEAHREEYEKFLLHRLIRSPASSRPRQRISLSERKTRQRRRRTSPELARGSQSCHTEPAADFTGLWQPPWTKGDTFKWLT